MQPIARISDLRFILSQLSIEAESKSKPTLLQAGLTELAA
jgi:hypothetical protein